MQLLHQYCPIAAGFLAVLVPIMEPVGFSMATKDTLLGYEYTPMAVVAIAVSAVLGLLVSLSTFLVIGATSSLTYNVVGHIKTVIILAGAFCPVQLIPTLLVVEIEFLHVACQVILVGLK